jgi:hypothetical protein
MLHGYRKAFWQYWFSLVDHTQGAYGFYFQLRLGESHILCWYLCESVLLSSLADVLILVYMKQHERFLHPAVSWVGINGTQCQRPNRLFGRLLQCDSINS